MLFIWDTCMVSHDADIRAAVELFLWSQAHTSLASDGILTPRVTCEQRHEDTSRALMEGINMEKSSQGWYKAMQLSQ